MFVAKVSVTICLVCCVAFFIGYLNRSPFPRIMNWGDWLGTWSMLIGGISALVFLLAIIWH